MLNPFPTEALKHGIPLLITTRPVGSTEMEKLYREWALHPSQESQDSQDTPCTYKPIRPMGTLLILTLMKARRIRTRVLVACLIHNSLLPLPVITGTTC